MLHSTNEAPQPPTKHRNAPCQDAVLRFLHNTEEPINATMQIPGRVAGSRALSIHPQPGNEISFVLITLAGMVAPTDSSINLAGIGSQFFC